MLSERDSKLYNKSEFCEQKNHRHLKKIMIYKAKRLMMTKKIPIKVYIFQKTVQVDEIEQVTIKNCLNDKITLNWWFSINFYDDALK